jgi:hypothetical protein
MTPQEAASELHRIDAELELRKVEEELERRKETKQEGVHIGPLSDIPRHGARTIRDVIASTGNIVDFPFLPFEVARYGVEHLRGKNPKFGEWLPGTAEKIKHGIDTLTGGYTKPRNKSEELVSDVVESVGTLPVGTGVASITSKIPSFMKIGKIIGRMYAPTAANIGASVGAPIAVRRYQESIPDAGPIGTLLAGTTGALLGGYGAAKSPGLLKGLRHPIEGTKNAFAESVGKATKFSPKRYKEWQDLGIPSTLGSASESVHPLGLELIMAKMPGTHKYISPVLQQRMEKMARAAGIKEKDLRHAVANPKEYLAKEGALTHKEAKSAEYKAHEAGWGEFEKDLIRKQTTADIGDILGKIEDEYKLGAIKKTDLKHFEQTFPGQVYEDLKESVKDCSSPSALPDYKKIVKDLEKYGLSTEAAHKYATQIVEKATSEPPQASLQVLKDLKEEALNRSQSPTLSDNEKMQATAIHNMLRDKIVDVMEQHGTPELVKGAKEAKRLWAEYASSNQSDMKQNIKELLRKRTETAAFESLFNRQKKHLEAASKYLPPSQKLDLAESMIASVGKKDGYWSPVKAFSAFDNWSPKIQQDFLNLFPNAHQRENFLNVKRLVEDNKERIQKIANTSGTAPTAAVIDSAKTVAKALKNIAVGTATAKGIQMVAGMEGLALSGIGYLLVKGGAKLWTDPLFLERVNRVMQAKTPSSMGNNLSLLLRTPSVKHLKKVNRLSPLVGERELEEEEE